MKKAIVSFANQKNNYVKAMERLSESLRHNFDGDFLGFVGESTCGAPLHSENPYAFKIYCIQKAIDAGYEQILWLDSSCFAVKNVQPIFDYLETHWCMVQDSGHWLGTWANDRSLEYFGIARDEAMEIRMIGNAGFLGLNVNTMAANSFMSQCITAMHKGIFKGAWNNNEKTESQDERCLGHRHDMVASSCILYKMGVIPEGMVGGEEWLQYGGPYTPIINDSIVLKAEGM